MSERITVDPERMGGVPCIRDVRIPVATVLRRLSEGDRHVDDILAEYPDLTEADIRAALLYAADRVSPKESP